MKDIINFFGSLLVLALATGIFLLLMDRPIPESNREILISFISVMFGAVAASMHKITGAGPGDNGGNNNKNNNEENN